MTFFNFYLSAFFFFFPVATDCVSIQPHQSDAKSKRLKKLLSKHSNSSSGGTRDFNGNRVTSTLLKTFFLDFVAEEFKGTKELAKLTKKLKDLRDSESSPGSLANVKKYLNLGNTPTADALNRKLGIFFESFGGSNTPSSTILISKFWLMFYKAWFWVWFRIKLCLYLGGLFCFPLYCIRILLHQTKLAHDSADDLMTCPSSRVMSDSIYWTQVNESTAVSEAASAISSGFSEGRLSSVSLTTDSTEATTATPLRIKLLVNQLLHYYHEWARFLWSPAPLAAAATGVGYCYYIVFHLLAGKMSDDLFMKTKIKVILDDFYQTWGDKIFEFLDVEPEPGAQRVVIMSAWSSALPELRRAAEGIKGKVQESLSEVEDRRTKKDLANLLDSIDDAVAHFESSLRQISKNYKLFEKGGRQRLYDIMGDRYKMEAWFEGVKFKVMGIEAIDIKLLAQQVCEVLQKTGPVTVVDQARKKAKRQPKSFEIFKEKVLDKLNREPKEIISSLEKQLQQIEDKWNQRLVRDLEPDDRGSTGKSLNESTSALSPSRDPSKQLIWLEHIEEKVIAHKKRVGAHIRDLKHKDKETAVKLTDQKDELEAMKIRIQETRHNYNMKQMLERKTSEVQNFYSGPLLQALIAELGPVEGYIEEENLEGDSSCEYIEKMEKKLVDELELVTKKAAEPVEEIGFDEPTSTVKVSTPGPSDSSSTTTSSPPEATVTVEAAADDVDVDKVAVASGPGPSDEQEKSIKNESGTVTSQASADLRASAAASTFTSFDTTAESNLDYQCNSHNDTLATRKIVSQSQSSSKLEHDYYASGPRPRTLNYAKPSNWKRYAGDPDLEWNLNPWEKIVSLPTAEIQFAQDSIGSTFHDGRSVQHMIDKLSKRVRLSIILLALY